MKRVGFYWWAKAGSPYLLNRWRLELLAHEVQGVWIYDQEKSASNSENYIEGIRLPFDVESKSASWSFKLKQFVEVFRQLNLDVLIMLAPKPYSAMAAAAAKLAGIKTVIAELHNQPYSITSYEELYALKCLVDSVNVLSNEHGANVLKATGSDICIHVVPNGVHEHKDSDVYVSNLSLTERNAGVSHYYVSAIRFCLQKDIDTLIDAVVEVVKKLPQAKFVIAGDGVLHNYAKNRVRDSDLQNNIELPGELSNREVCELISKSTAVIQSTHYEGMPVLMLEAMIRSKCFIGTKVDGIMEHIVDSVNGMLYDANDAQGLAERIISAASGAVCIKTIGKNAKKYVTDSYTITHSAQRWIDSLFVTEDRRSNKIYSIDYIVLHYETLDKIENGSWRFDEESCRLLRSFPDELFVIQLFTLDRCGKMTSGLFSRLRERIISAGESLNNSMLGALQRDYVLKVIWWERVYGDGSSDITMRWSQQLTNLIGIRKYDKYDQYEDGFTEYAKNLSKALSVLRDLRLINPGLVRAVHEALKPYLWISADMPTYLYHGGRVLEYVDRAAAANNYRIITTELNHMCGRFFLGRAHYRLGMVSDDFEEISSSLEQAYRLNPELIDSVYILDHITRFKRALTCQ